MELIKDNSPINRSLIRGIEILRCFKPGIDFLGNSEISERTGLAPSTVSRLTKTLVLCGYLEHNRRRSAYRLAPAVLSLGHAFKTTSPELRVAEPLMRKVSEKLKLNVGLAVADRLEMVYLESIRYTKQAPLRIIAAGQRVPIEKTSLGRAWIANLDENDRLGLINDLKKQKLKNWVQIECEIQAAIDSMQTKGYCLASWLPEVSAISTIVQINDHSYAVLNISKSSDSSYPYSLENLAPELFELQSAIELAIKRRA
jgi:DNA-binding IclR family transcriptional regulator